MNPLDLYGSTNFFSDSGTSHTSIIAPNGDAVAVTSSINLKYFCYTINYHTFSWLLIIYKFVFTIFLQLKKVSNLNFYMMYKKDMGPN